MRLSLFIGACALSILALAIRLQAAEYVGRDLFVLMPPFPNQPYPQFDVNTYDPSIAFGGQVVGESNGGPNVSPISNALVWTIPNGEIINLHPANLAGFDTSVATATNGVQQVGSGGGRTFLGSGGFSHALLWNGTADSVVDLHPTSLTEIDNSFALGLGGGQQVGAGYSSATRGVYHAFVWNGTANSAVDLHPNFNRFDSSLSYGTDGTRQVGYIFDSVNAGHRHAVLWNSTANSAIDLNPTNLPSFDSSAAFGIHGIWQVGYGGGLGVGDFTHALLWRSAANSAIDLNPLNLTGFVGSIAYNTDGVSQVGYGFRDDGSHHALLWTGTADSTVDLDLLLPSTLSGSIAYTIDAQGNVWGTAFDSAGDIHAVEWSLVPEPASLALLTLGAVGLLSFRRGYAIDASLRHAITSRTHVLQLALRSEGFPDGAGKLVGGHDADDRRFLAGAERPAADS